MPISLVIIMAFPIPTPKESDAKPKIMIKPITKNKLIGKITYMRQQPRTKYKQQNR